MHTLSIFAPSLQSHGIYTTRHKDVVFPSVYQELAHLADRNTACLCLGVTPTSWADEDADCGNPKKRATTKSWTQVQTQMSQSRTVPL